MPSEEANFTYASQPHSAPVKKRTTRVNEELGVPLTLMSDPRVIRGNTHTLAKKISKAKADSMKTMQLRSPTRHAPLPEPPSNPSYSYQVKPFATDDLDVSSYLTEQKSSKPKMKEVDSQTNEFLPKPTSPKYIPRKTGIDRSTQVEDVRDLFIFDKEVIPILELIVQKTLEQSLFEVQSEEELKCLDDSLHKFDKERRMEDEWVQKKEADAAEEFRQRIEEIRRLIAQKESERLTRFKIASLEMMKQVIPVAIEEITNSNMRRGVWRSSEALAVEKLVVPFLLHDTKMHCQAHQAACEVLDEILLESESKFVNFPSYVEFADAASSATVSRRGNADAENEVVVWNGYRYHCIDQFTLVLRFTTADEESSNTNDEDEDDGAVASSRAVKSKAAAVVTARVTAQDSAASLELKIRSEIARRKALVEAQNNPPAEDSENATTTTAPAAEQVNPNEVKLLPDPTYPLRLEQRLSAFVDTGRYNCCTEIARDALLFSFPFPDKVAIEFTV